MLGRHDEKPLGRLRGNSPAGAQTRAENERKMMEVPSGRIELRVTERLGIERRNYPVTVGVPFPAGELHSIEQVRVLDCDAREVPCQVARMDLSDWPDGSVKGVRLDFQATMGPEQTALYTLEYGGGPGEAAPATPVGMQEDADTLRVHTGPLEFEISKRSFRLFESVRLNGVEMIDASRPRGFFLTSVEDKVYESGLARSPEVQVESSGPLRASVRIKGAHTAPDGDEFMDFDVRIEAFAGAPFVKVTYGFYNMGRHVELRLVDPFRGSLFRVPYSSVRDIRLKTPLRIEAETEALIPGDRFYVHRVRGDASLYYGWCPRLNNREGLGHILRYKGEDNFLYPGTTQDSSSGCEVVDQGEGRTMQIRYATHEGNFCPMDVEEVLRDEPDGTREVFYLGSPDGWVDISNAQRGAAVFVRLFGMLPPKQVELTSDSVETILWPARAGDLDLGEGSGKSHEMFFLFHEGSGVEQKVDWLCEAFREPLVCAVEPAWIQRTGLLGDIYPVETANRPNFEKRLRHVFEGWIGGSFFESWAGSSPSMMNYPEMALATPVAKGNASNNDGDAVMSLMLQFARTGEPRYFLAARDQARHTMDVDFIRYSPDPLMHEGIHMHSYDHVTAISQPSHVWIEGMLDYYYLTGEPEAIFVCRSVGRHLSRQVFADRLMCYCDEREAGWPLIMFSALYRATSDKGIERAARHVVDMLDAWQDKISGIWLSRWRQEARYNMDGGGFQRAVVFCGLYQWWKATGDEQAREIFRRGIFTFSDEVSEITSFGGRDFINLECLAYAYTMLGDRTCIEKAMRAWRFVTRMGQGEYPVDGGALRSAFPFLQVADELGLVSRDYED